MNPRFITLDGIDGVDKPTDLAVMKQWFEARRFPVLFTREPGGTSTDEALREILLSPETKASLRTGTLSTFTAHWQYLGDVILLAFKDDIYVVSDRFINAISVCQGGGKGVPLQDIETLENWVQSSLWLDLTLLLDVPLEVLLERISRVRGKDRFERGQVDFSTRVCNAYFSRVIVNPERYAMTDGNRSPEAARTSIGAALEAHFGFIGRVVWNAPRLL